jgi:hypothetical protein
MMANWSQWLVTYANYATGQKVKLKNLFLNDPKGWSFAGPYTGFRPYDEENIKYTNTGSLNTRWIALRDTYPNYDPAAVSPDFSNPLKSIATKIRATGFLTVNYLNFTASALEMSDVEASAPGAPIHVPVAADFGTGFRGKFKAPASNPQLTATFGNTSLCHLQATSLGAVEFGRGRKFQRDYRFDGVTLDLSAYYTNGLGERVRHFGANNVIGALGLMEATGAASENIGQLVGYKAFGSEIGGVLTRSSGGGKTAVQYADPDFTQIKKGAFRFEPQTGGIVSDCALSGGKYTDCYNAATPEGLIQVKNAGFISIVKNDYKDSGYPSLALDDSNSHRACVWLYPDAHDCTVHDTGGYATQPGVENHVVNEGTNNRIVGTNARNVAKPAGIGSVQHESAQLSSGFGDEQE